MAHAIDPSVTLLICSSFLIIQHEIPLPPPSWAHATGPSPNILRVQSFVLPDGCYYYTSSIHHAIIERVSIYTISSRSACASSSPNIFANEPMSVPISDVNELTKGGRLFWGEKTKIGQHVLLTGRLFSHCGEGEKPVGPVLIRRGGGGESSKVVEVISSRKILSSFFIGCQNKRRWKWPTCAARRSRACVNKDPSGPGPLLFLFSSIIVTLNPSWINSNISLSTKHRGLFLLWREKNFTGGFVETNFFFHYYKKEKSTDRN